MWDPGHTTLPSGFVFAMSVLSCIALLSLLSASSLLVLLVRKREYLRERCPQLLVPMMVQCGADTLWSAVAIMMFAPAALNLTWPTPIESKAGCSALGFLSDFSQVLSVGYYTVMTAQAYVVVRRYPRSVVGMVNNSSHFVVFLLAVFVGLVPLSMGQYGPVGKGRVECWIVGSSNPLRFLFYSVVLAAFLWAVYVLMAVWCSGSPALGHSGKRVLKRLVLFVVVFMVLWVLPLVDRAVPFVAGTDSPFPLAMAHLVSLCSIGLVNTLVWLATRPVQNAMRGTSFATGSTYGTMGATSYYDSINDVEKVSYDVAITSVPDSPTPKLWKIQDDSRMDSLTALGASAP